MNRTTNPNWLFVGIYPNAQVYCDRRREKSGDYHRIATIYFNTATWSEFRVHDDAPKYRDVVTGARADFEAMLEAGMSSGRGGVPMRRKPAKVAS